MTIASEIQRIKTNIANAYTNAESKGATLPEVQNSDNLATCINSISGGGIQYTGNLNFVPIGNCKVDANGIMTDGGFALDCMYNSDSLKNGDQGSYLNYYFPKYANIAVRVRFKPNELNKTQVITGTRTNNNGVSSTYMYYGVSFILNSDNNTITAVTSSGTTITGTLTTSATTEDFVDVFLVGYYPSGWQLQMFQTTDLMQTWTAISSLVSGKIGVDIDDVIGKKLSEISFGEGYYSGYKFKFNGEIDTLNTGIYRMYGSEAIVAKYPIAQNSAVIVYTDNPTNTTLSITDNVASGFSSNPLACICCTKVFAPNFGDNWERGVKITTGSDITTEQWIFGATSDYQGYGLAIKDGKLKHFICGWGSTSWSTGVGSIDLSINTDYYIKTTSEYHPDGTGWYVLTTFISTDGITWQQDYTFTVSGGAPIAPQNTIIGMYATFDIPFLGSIDLAETYWSINGSEVWRGADV